jgi:hypothetical protein
MNDIFKQMSHDCEHPTYTQGASMTTLAYYVPVFDENGVNTNPDRNNSTTTYTCTKCNTDFLVVGNDYDGYEVTKR